MAESEKVPYKLPSGKYVYVPGGMTKKQVEEWLFEKLEDNPDFEEDRLRLGDDIETSGWGAGIGGLIGGLGGAAAGVFTSPSLVVNPITLGAAGGAAGSALGESFEQWLTGKGDYGDIGKSAALGGVGGAIPGGAVSGGLLKGAARGAGVGAIGGGASGAIQEGTIGGAAKGAAAGAVSGGVLGDLGGKALRTVAKKSGLDRQVDNVLDPIIRLGKSELNSIFLKATGRATAGNLNKAAGRWEARRDLIGYLGTKYRKSTGKNLTPAEEVAIGNKADKILKDRLETKSAKVKAETGPSDGGQITRPDLDEVATMKDDILSGRAKKQSVPGDDGELIDVYVGPSGSHYDDNGSLISGFNKGGKLSDKIGLLRREGYPQKQAVAIAHSYKNRGMLK